MTEMWFRIAISAAFTAFFCGGIGVGLILGCLIWRKEESRGA